MPLIRNLEGFPFGIRQPKDSGWCIPASIEVVTKYHVPNSTMTQQQIVNAFVNYTKWPIESIGLKSIKEVMEHDSEFSWAEKQYFEDFEFHGFNGLAHFLEECVDESKPPIISIPVPFPNGKWDGWHMNVIVGYDANFFRIYDPNPAYPIPWRDIPKFTFQSNLLSKKMTTDTTDSLLIFPRVNLPQNAQPTEIAYSNSETCSKNCLSTGVA